jgi:uncharacterized damage-inducible protein DinB
VRVAYGRDYGDVAPVRGVYKGHAGQRLSVDVRLRPVVDGEGHEQWQETAAGPPTPAADSLDVPQQQPQQQQQLTTGRSSRRPLAYHEPMAASPLIAHFQMRGRYNTVVNQRLYEACARLTDVAYRQERAGSFGSIHRLLNHILLGDRLWMERFTASGVTSTPALGTILYDDFTSLRAAREIEDAGIEAFLSGLSENFFARQIEYVNNAGKLCADPASLVLAHFFNHQTHHRGQIHVMLSQTGMQPPSLDMHRAIRP